MRRLELNLVSNLILHNTKMCIEGYCQFLYDIRYFITFILTLILF
jgi:hypothetical protein